MTFITASNKSHQNIKISDNEFSPMSVDLTQMGIGPETFSVERYWQAVDQLAKNSDQSVIRMDFGVPGLNPIKYCEVQHEIAIKNRSFCHTYPPYEGTKSVRLELAKFVSKRIPSQINHKNVFSTCGATQALMVAQSVAVHTRSDCDTIVYLTPAYPPMLSQGAYLGKRCLSVDTTQCRGDALIEKLATLFQQYSVACICWASPSNPLWNVLSKSELREIARLCDAYNVLPIEDLTYLGMLSDHQGGVRVIPSITQFSDRYFLILSCSKMMSYAGERIGFLIGSEPLLESHSECLKPRYLTNSIRTAVGSLIFNSTAGAPHSAQEAVANTLRAINNEKINIERYLSQYARRAHLLKQVLKRRGFTLINHDQDLESDDGFYVCFEYQCLPSMELLQGLLRLGISVMPLNAFHTNHSNGVRACVGRSDCQDIIQVENRLKHFEEVVANGRINKYSGHSLECPGHRRESGSDVGRI